MSNNYLHLFINHNLDTMSLSRTWQKIEDIIGLLKLLDSMDRKQIFFLYEYKAIEITCKSCIWTRYSEWMHSAILVWKISKWRYESWKWTRSWTAFCS